ncbi:hypothetical protein BD770DRAFT_154618 [Pilaira anomala]|nr:hypothetical protein BD770DRAFT_154618 [Pilaira anomala]
MTSSAAIFTPLPTEDHEEEIESQSVITEKNTDQILDGLLAKVGYGLFQKKLLVLCGFGWLADNVSLYNYSVCMN